MKNLINYHIEETKNQHNEYFNKHLLSEINYKDYVLKKTYDCILSIINDIKNDNTDFQLKHNFTEKDEKYSSMDAVLFHFDFFKEKYLIKYSIIEFLLEDSLLLYNKIIKENFRQTSKLVSINNKLKLATKNNIDRLNFKKGTLSLLYTLIDPDELTISISFVNHLEKNSSILYFIENNYELHIFIKSIISIVLLENIELIVKKDEECDPKKLFFQKVDIKNYKRNIY